MNQSDCSPNQRLSTPVLSIRNHSAATAHQIASGGERTSCANNVSYRGLVAALALCAMTGCASTADLEKLKTELQESGAATKKELDQKLTPIAQSVETLKGATKAGFEETKKQLEERERLLAQDLKAQQEALKKVDSLVNVMRATLAELSGKTETLAKDSGEIRAVAKASNRSLHDFLKAQEAAYQEALRSIRATLSELGGSDEKPK